MIIVDPDGPTESEFRRMTIPEKHLSELKKLSVGVLKINNNDTDDLSQKLLEKSE